MRIRMTTGMRQSFSAYSINGQPVTIISRHYHSKPRQQKTAVEVERDSRLDKTYHRA